jgi:drug/metabolite transporter (DMT)-like permease
MNYYNLGFVLTEFFMLLIGKYLLNLGVHPYFYALITGIPAAIIILFWFKLRPTLTSFLASLPTALFFTIANSLGFAALKLTSLTNYNFIIQISVLIMPVFGWLFLKEKIRPLVFPLAVVNLSGIALLSGFYRFQINSGDWLTLLAAVFLSLDFVWQKKAALKINQDEVAFWRRLIASLILGTFWLALPQLGTASWQYALTLIPVSLLYVGFSLLMVRCLKSQPVADFNLFITLSPVLTAIAAYWLLNEIMNPYQFLGAGLIMASILVYNWSRKEKS